MWYVVFGRIPATRMERFCPEVVAVMGEVCLPYVVSVPNSTHADAPTWLVGSTYLATSEFCVVPTDPVVSVGPSPPPHPTVRKVNSALKKSAIRIPRLVFMGSLSPCS